jgi:hypothetical protein
METPFFKTFSDLQKRWHCVKHQFCYREPLNGKEQHFEFEPSLWSLWAQQIENGHAVANYPPRIPEFTRILDAARNGSRIGKSSQRIASSDHDGLKGLILNLNHGGPPLDYYPPPPRSRRYSDPSPQKQRKRYNTGTLEQIGYSTTDWTGQGLDDYFDWLADKFPPSEKWHQTLSKFKEQEIGLHLLLEGSIGPQFLVDNCEVASGMAARVLGNFKMWCDEKLLARESE